MPGYGRPCAGSCSRPIRQLKDWEEQSCNIFQVRAPYDLLLICSSFSSYRVMRYINLAERQ